ncbi:ABC transporter ATP-binding protein, partial [Isoptericola sp. NPDC060282]
GWMGLAGEPEERGLGWTPRDETSAAAARGGVASAEGAAGNARSAAEGSAASSVGGVGQAAVWSAAEVRAARKEIARVERRLGRIADEEKALHEQIAADPTDFGAVAALDEKLRRLGAEKEELELAWLEAAEVAG